MVRVEAAGKIYKHVQSSKYLGVTPDISVEIARRTRACWMRNRRYLRELYDQQKAAPSLKTRMVRTEVIDALLQDAVLGPFARNTTPNFKSYTTGSSFAPYRGTAQEARPSVDLVHLCPRDYQMGEHGNVAHEKTFMGGGAYPNERRAGAKANRVRKP